VKSKEGLCGKICPKWRTVWVIISDKYIGHLSTSEDDGPDDIMLIDTGFTITFGQKETGHSKGIKIKNLR
jgi:hypothetical protein